MPTGPFDTINTRITQAVAAKSPDLNTAVRAALDPKSINAMVDQHLANIDQMIQQRLAAKIADCIAEKLGVTNIIAQIEKKIDEAINAIVSTDFNC